MAGNIGSWAGLNAANRLSTEKFEKEWNKEDVSE